MSHELEDLIGRYRKLGIDRQLDYEKFYLYSIITHSTAIEGSTITEIENQIMFDHGIALKGKNLIEQNMNLDLKAAYERVLGFAHEHADVTEARLKALSALTMKNTGTVYHTMFGDFSSAEGDLRLLNVSAGVGGKSYMSYNKVPEHLKAFCDALNLQRKKAGKMSVQALYEMSFDAHYHLVTIHPWADGNGRMARLLMNWLQSEFGLVPSCIFAEEKEAYIKALMETREKEDLSVFRRFMTGTMIDHLTREIEAFLNSTGECETADSQCFSEGRSNYQVYWGYAEARKRPVENQRPKRSSTTDRIMTLLQENPKHTSKSLAEAIGISAKGIEKQLAKLKAEGRLQRIGADRGGHWEVI